MAVTSRTTANKAGAKAKVITPAKTAEKKTTKNKAVITTAGAKAIVEKKTVAKKAVTKKTVEKKPAAATPSVPELLDVAMAALKRASSKTVRDGMTRFNIPNTNALGVKMGDIQKVGKQLGRHHELAEALWKTGVYEARMLCAYVAELERVTPAQMDRWAKDFDNWAVCDTLCFALWDRTPHAWKKAEQWTKKTGEFEKRAGFALFWCLSVHDKAAPDAGFLKGLQLIESAATDERHFVKKAVNMALRAIGKRNKALNAAAVTVATRLAASQDATAKWIGKDALREIASPAVKKRVSAK